ncbi:MFS transporter [Demequina sp.]|uniref:MFS transporter n=1 Tax=Demequina sp. TaxID=2050685 RepID=UPI003D12FC6A
MTTSALAPSAARVARARYGVLGLFWLMGVLLSTYVSRVPSVAELLDVTTGRLALLMLAGAMGALVALTVTGWVVAKFGTRRVLWWSTFVYLAAFLTVAWSTAIGSQFWFASGQFFVSFAFAFTNVSMNAEAANVEHWMRRAVMPHFHASFSVGMAMGLALGAGLSHAGVSPAWHFASVALALTVVRLAIIPAAVVHGAPDPGGAPGGFGGPFKTARNEYRDRRVVLIGLIVFAASTIEGAAAQWSSLAVVQAFDATEAVGDIAYWVFVVAMVTTRGFGAHIIGRAGRVVSLRVSAALVFVGVLIFAFTPVFWAVPVAMILWGLGAGLGVPIGFSAASDDPTKSAARVAAVSSFATVAGLIMPQVIGHLGDVIELRKALTVACVAAVLSFAIARAVRTEGPLFRSHRALARSVSGASAIESDAVRFEEDKNADGIPDEFQDRR